MEFEFSQFRFFSQFHFCFSVLKSESGPCFEVYMPGSKVVFAAEAITGLRFAACVCGKPRLFKFNSYL